jgi:hypothetical protein
MRLEESRTRPAVRPGALGAYITGPSVVESIGAFALTSEWGEPQSSFPADPGERPDVILLDLNEAWTRVELK